MLIGCDPEFFIGTTKKVKSAIGIVQGTKDSPYHIMDNIYVHEDNVAVELNMPAASPSTFSRKYQYAFDVLNEYVSNLGYHILDLSSNSMDKSELTDPRAWVFGCDPDFNAWTESVNPKPSCDDPKFRSAGGHIHIGLNPGEYGVDITDEMKISLVKWLDYYVGAPLAAADIDTERKKLYGKAGAFRFKSYGVEYRTPSNWWARRGASHFVATYVSNAVRAWAAHDYKYTKGDAVQQLLDFADRQYIIDWCNKTRHVNLNELGALV